MTPTKSAFGIACTTFIIASAALAQGPAKTVPETTPAAGAQATTECRPAVLKEHIMIAPKDVKWGDCPPVLPPGAKCATVEGDMKAANQLFAYRLKMPNNFKVAPHFHPADEHVIVVQGVFNMGMGDKLDTKATTAMPAGSFVAIPKGSHHFAWAKGETIVQVYAIGPWGLTYVNPEDDPRNAKKTN